MEQVPQAAPEAAPQGGNPLEAIGQMVEGMMAAAEQSGKPEAIQAAQAVAQSVDAFMGIMGGQQQAPQEAAGPVAASGQGANAVPAEL